MNNELKHFGVMGMKWGHRKGDDSVGVSDHSRVEKIKWTRLAQLSDDDVKIAVERMRLVKQYKEARKGLRSLQDYKPISTMSNNDLKTEIKREKLLKEDWTSGVRKTKRIRSMTPEEVEKTFKRHFLEKPYRELLAEERAPGIKVAKYFLKVAARLMHVVAKVRSSRNSDDTVDGQYYEIYDQLPSGLEKDD